MPRSLILAVTSTRSPGHVIGSYVYGVVMNFWQHETRCGGIHCFHGPGFTGTQSHYWWAPNAMQNWQRRAPRASCIKRTKRAPRIPSSGRLSLRCGICSELSVKTAVYRNPSQLIACDTDRPAFRELVIALNHFLTGLGHVGGERKEKILSHPLLHGDTC